MFSSNSHTGVISINTGKHGDPKSYMEKVLEELKRTSTAKQMMIGVSSGWITGFFTMKIGRTAALAIGGGIILLQFASNKDYIKINWEKVNKNIENVTENLEEVISNDQKATWIDKIAKFAQDNTTLSTSFIGGLFIGLASH